MSTGQPPLRDSYEGIYNRALDLARAGDIEGSIRLFRRLTDRLASLTENILRRRPELGELHLQARQQLVSLLASEGRYAEAIEVEQVLLDTHPGEARRWHRELAVLRCAKGEVETGLKELQALAEDSPGDFEGWLLLGIENRLAGRFGDSHKSLDKALGVCQQTDAEDCADIHYQRFLLFKEMKQLDDAIAAWEVAISQNPEIGRTIRQVYEMLTRAGRYSDAQRYIARDENRLQADFQRGLISSLTGKSLEARETWRQVARLDPNDYEYGHDAWVEAVLRLGDPDPALEWLQDALPRFGTPRLLVLSGIGWAMREDEELAGVLFQQAINMQRRQRPPKKKLDSTDWQLLDSLVSDEEAKTALKSYFAVIATLWG
jgi:tetratricopeptide (TPR) repeat protein